MEDGIFDKARVWLLTFAIGLVSCTDLAYSSTNLKEHGLQEAGQIRNTDSPLPPPPTKSPELEEWWRSTEPGSVLPEEIQQNIPTEALIEWLVHAYQAEVSLEEVQTALQATQWQTNDDALQQADIDGDGINEWLMTTYFLDPEWLMPWANPGDFWIVGQEGLEYRFFTPDRYFDGDYEAQPEFALGAPTVISTADLTGDGLSDVALSRQTCGAHTCTYFFSILSHHHGDLDSVVQLPESPEGWATEDTIVKTYAEVQPTRDATGDGISDFLIYGGQVGSAGSGIQRTLTEIWAWNGEAIALADVRLDPTEYRYHLLWEANDEFDQDNFARASELYQQVIRDRTLLDEGSFNDEQAVYDDSRQFAAFRLALIGLLTGKEVDGEAWHQWLREEYGMAPITEAAKILIMSSENEAVEASCDVVTTYLQQFEVTDGEWVTESPTGTLRDLGYANPSLTAIDVCPL